jgi:antibiotic biosynthesis monooxygenase (ABM) superfamily enzyme
MPFSLIKVNYKDYDEWKDVFNKAADERKGASAKGWRVFTTMGNRNEAWILMEIDDLAKFKAFMESPELQEKMKESGITGPPERYILQHEFDG